MFNRYDVHLASQSFIMSQIDNYSFDQTFGFDNFDLDLWYSLNNNRDMIVMMNP